MDASHKGRLLTGEVIAASNCGKNESNSRQLSLLTEQTESYSILLENTEFDLLQQIYLTKRQHSFFIYIYIINVQFFAKMSKL